MTKDVYAMNVVKLLKEKSINILMTSDEIPYSLKLLLNEQNIFFIEYLDSEDLKSFSHAATM